ncbi:MAG: energy-coupling factor transporter transmembrane protein EcfT, partial [Firmicutes bacterium]|nr:energy-coupling factor transporter transmembrane protein EcfT [Bacillota bacterium]
MIRDITLGQYYPAPSPIHRLDARTKLIATMLYIVAVFVANDIIGFGLVFLALAAVVAASKVPLRFILRGLKPVFFLIAF